MTVEKRKQRALFVFNDERFRLELFVVGLVERVERGGPALLDCDDHVRLIGEAGMIEANRAMYRDKEKVVPIIAKATEKPKEAVEYAIDVLTKHCVWSINTGFESVRTQWTIDNSAENGDIEKDKKPTIEQVANTALAKEAVEVAGGPVTIGNCKE